MAKTKLKVMASDLLFTGCVIVIVLHTGPIVGLAPLGSQIAAFFAGRTAIRFVGHEYENEEYFPSINTSGNK